MKLTSCGSASVSPSNLSSAAGLPEISLFTCEQNNHKLIAKRQIRFTLKIPHQSFLAVCWKHWGHWTITAGGSIGLSDRTVSQSWEQDHAGVHPIRAQRLSVNTTTQTQGFTRLNFPCRATALWLPLLELIGTQRKQVTPVRCTLFLYILHHIQPIKFSYKTFFFIFACVNMLIVQIQKK